MNGVVYIIKPPGMSSSGAVVYARRLLSQKRIGHAGTLDPGAAGVLALCVGRSTRIADYLMERPKTYIAEALFGVETDTLDSYGSVTARCTCAVSEAQVRAALPALTGAQMQTPPAYSAVKIDGCASYKLARKGAAVQKPPRCVEIYALELLRQTGENRFLLRMACSKGTYVRVVVQELGRALGIPATTSFLLRTQACGGEISEAYTLDELAALTEAGDCSFLTPPEQALGFLPCVTLDAKHADALKNGCAVCEKAPEGAFALRCGGVFLGVGKADDAGVKLAVPLFDLPTK